MVEATFVQLLFWFCPLPQTTIKSGKCGSWLPSVTQFGAVQLLCNRSWREGGGEGGQDIILYSTGCGGRGKYEFVWFLHFLIKISIFKFFAFLATKNIPMDSRDTRADPHRAKATCKGYQWCTRCIRRYQSWWSRWNSSCSWISIYFFAWR